MERRLKNRILIDSLFDVSASLPNKTADISLKLLDLSETGARFNLPNDYYASLVDEEFTIRIHINSLLFLSLKATVKNKEGETYGVVFNEVNDSRHLAGVRHLVQLFEVLNDIDSTDPYLA
jgi:hypothetical protein